ncbi:hypothetical protein [Nocardioides sp. SR21]|uniref:hypothetical protein n=1 Tax=Nocardioides sp. SR21 TaxID=2919501 RepID=UPI001FAA4132|nr:hypothetical protein [Nocardioides sp. SR21]
MKKALGALLLCSTLSVTTAATLASSGAAVPAPSAAKAATTTDPNPSPQTASFSTTGSTTLKTTAGEAVHVRYPTVNGAIAPKRPVVLIGHGMGMGSNMANVMNNGAFLNKAGYVTVSSNMDAQSSYTNKARLMSRALDAVLAAPSLTAGVLPNRVGYYGGSNGAITGVTMQDPTVRDKRIKAFVLRSPWAREGKPSWTDAPPILVMLGTADTTIAPANSRAVYNAMTFPKGKIELSGAKHDMVLSGSNIVQDSSKAFFARYLGGVATGLNTISPMITKDTRLNYVFDWTSD